MRCYITLFGLLLFTLVKAAAQTKITVPFYTAYRTTHDAGILDIGSPIRKDGFVLLDTSNMYVFIYILIV